MKRLLSLIAGGIFVFVSVYWLVVGFFMPNLPDRALFGESFGGLSALFSGMALIGVVCALFLQQRQLEFQKKDNDDNLSLVRAQLSETRKAIQLQHQPVLQLRPEELIVNKPSLFLDVPAKDNVCDALSRYRLAFDLRNLSDTPAIDATAIAILVAKSDSSLEKIGTTGSHFSAVTRESTVSDDFLFVPNTPFVTLFEAIRDKDASRIPAIETTLLYKNLMGACFIVRQAFHILPPTEESLLVRWQTAITSFPIVFKSDLGRLRVLAAEPSRWQESFDDLKRTFVGGIDGPNQMALRLGAIPGAHEARHITESEYASVVGAIRFPKRTFGHTECPEQK